MYNSLIELSRLSAWLLWQMTYLLSLDPRDSCSKHEVSTEILKKLDALNILQYLFRQSSHSFRHHPCLSLPLLATQVLPKRMPLLTQ
jgi:hypothetical protein